METAAREAAMASGEYIRGSSSPRSAQSWYGDGLPQNQYPTYTFSITRPGASTIVCGTVAGWCGSVYSRMSSAVWSSRSASARNVQWAPVEILSL
jgi:hypothetical protein